MNVFDSKKICFVMALVIPVFVGCDGKEGKSVEVETKTIPVVVRAPEVSPPLVEAPVAQTTTASGENKFPKEKIKDHSATDDDEIEHVRLAVYELWEAFRLQDTERLNAIVDEEYVGSEGETKEQQIKNWVSPSYIIKSVDVDYENAQVNIDNNRAVVSYTATDRRSVNGESILNKNESTDVFVKKEGKWRIFRGTGKNEAHTDQL